MPVKSPWYHIGIDFVGPISPPSISGNSYILTVSDYFTRFGWAKALPTKEAVNVVQALREVFSPFPVKTRRGNRSGIRKKIDIKIIILQLQNA